MITRVDAESWTRAQAYEKAKAFGVINAGTDWNEWWAAKFNNYELLKGKHFPNVCEVGCGPHTNVRLLLRGIGWDRAFLEDPLIQFYICHPITDPPGLRRRLKNAVKRIIHRGTVASVSGTIGLVIENPGKVDLSSCKLESLPYPDGCMDLLMCVNVLDHVNDCDECIGQIHRVLKPGGVLVLGQDLTNDEDLRSCEECRLDIGHPIKIDHAYIGRSLQPYSAIFGRVLDREEGRTPAAHYGTYLGILRKN